MSTHRFASRPTNARESARRTQIESVDIPTKKLAKRLVIDVSSATKQRATPLSTRENIRLSWWLKTEKQEGHVIVRYRDVPEQEWSAVMEELSKAPQPRYVIVIGPAAPRDAKAEQARSTVLRWGHIWHSVSTISNDKQVRRTLERNLSETERRLSGYFDRPADTL